MSQTKVNEKIPVYVNKTQVAREMKTSIPTIERLLFREILTADALVWERGHTHALFLKSRVPELIGAYEAYLKEVEEARLSPLGK
jgi:hypothetical protein